MAALQGLLLVGLGLGVLVVAYRSLESGWLPFGNDIRGRLKLWRDEQPLGYWVIFVGYGAAGLWLLNYGLRVLVGAAEPLPLA